MKRKVSKLLSTTLAVALVFTSVFTTDFKAKAEVTKEEMVASAQYNLALKKQVVAAPSLQEGEILFVTDGKFTDLIRRK